MLKATLSELVKTMIVLTAIKNEAEQATIVNR